MPRTQAKIEREYRNSFHQNIIELYHGLVLYRNLKTTLTPPPHAPTSAVHDHSQLEPLFYNGEKDATRAEEYRRFRSLTSDIAAKPEGIKLGNSEVLGPLMYLLIIMPPVQFVCRILPLPPEKEETGAKWRKIGESLVGAEPFGPAKNRRLTQPASFPLSRHLSRHRTRNFPAKLKVSERTWKMDPTALFAAPCRGDQTEKGNRSHH